MGERKSGLFKLKSVRNLTLKSKRSQASLSAASSSTKGSYSLPPTPDSEFPTTPNDVQDFGLGYSSINHEHRSLAKRASSFGHLDRTVPELPFASKRDTMKPKEDAEPLFVTISDEPSSPASAVQSTVRAYSSNPLPTRRDSLSPGAKSPPQSPYTITTPRLQAQQLKRPSMPNFRANSDDSALKVKDTVGAKKSLSGPGPFYAVGRGWRKGVYASKEEADRQIRNFPGPVIKTFDDLNEALTFVEESKLKSPRAQTSEEADEERIERTRIFTGLDPNSAEAQRRTSTLAMERRESQRKSQLILSSLHSVNSLSALSSPHSQGTSPGTTTFSPTRSLSLQTMFAERSPVLAVEEFNATSALLNPTSQLAMTLLPVRDLASAVGFYKKVLGFTCVAETPGVQAVMSSSAAATVCLRVIEQAPPPPTGTSLSRLSMIRSSSLLRTSPKSPPLATLPTMSEDTNEEEEIPMPTTPELLLPPTLESTSLRPPSVAMPQRTSAPSLSGISVLIEYAEALESLHSLITARLNGWILERKEAANGTTQKTFARPLETARILNGVEQTPWNAQELHVCDLDGHRIIFTTPFHRLSPLCSSPMQT